MNYRRIEVDLSENLQDFEVDLGGSFTSILILKSGTKFGYKLNSKTADMLFSDELQGFQGDGLFGRVYITCEGRAGAKAILLVHD